MLNNQNPNTPPETPPENGTPAESLFAQYAAKAQENLQREYGFTSEDLEDPFKQMMVEDKLHRRYETDMKIVAEMFPNASTAQNEQFLVGWVNQDIGTVLNALKDAYRGELETSQNEQEGTGKEKPEVPDDKSTTDTPSDTPARSFDEALENIAAMGQ